MVARIIDTLGSTPREVPARVDAGLLVAAEVCPPLLWQARFDITAEAAGVLREHLLRLEPPDTGSPPRRGRRGSRRKFSPPLDTRTEAVRNGLESGEFPTMILRTEYRRLGETAKGRRLLARLILEEVAKRAAIRRR